MHAKDLVTQIKRFDAYPKTLEDFRVKTLTGAGVTLVSGFIMFALFISEINYYLTTEVSPELFVDTTRHQKLKINLDIYFPNLPCAYMSIDAMDVSGEQQSDIDHNIFKRRVDKDGKIIENDAQKENLGDKSGEAVKALQTTLDPSRCESCYGAETSDHPCCNDCESVRTAYRRKGWAFSDPDAVEQCSREGWKDKLSQQKDEGCNVYGYLEVSKVAGNFHIAPGKSFQQHHVHVNSFGIDNRTDETTKVLLTLYRLVGLPIQAVLFVSMVKLGKGANIFSINLHDLQPFGGTKFNVSHHIRHLSFGESYPGVHNPLDDTIVTCNESSTMFQYFVKIVPTVYKKLSGEVLWTNQYSFTKHKRNVKQMSGENGLPGVFVLYELSPMLVQYSEKRRSFMHFLTGVCAIIGGVFTVAGLIDSMIYHSAKALKKKIDLGKAS